MTRLDLHRVASLGVDASTTEQIVGAKLRGLDGAARRFQREIDMQRCGIPCRYLTFYGNLAAAALRSGRVAELVLRELAVDLKPSPGHRSVAKALLINEAHRLGIFTSAAHVRKLLERGHGALWHLGSDQVYLCGTAKVADALGADEDNAWRETIDTYRLRTAADRRGALLGVAIPEKTPMSQKRIAQLTGVSDRSQRRLRADGLLEARPQWANFGEVAADQSDRGLQAAAAAGARNGVFLDAKERLVKRLPNRYEPLGTRIPRGRRSKKMFMGRPRISNADGTRTAPRTRVFFRSIKSWLRCRGTKLGVPAADRFARPFNVAYVRPGGGGRRRRWTAICT